MKNFVLMSLLAVLLLPSCRMIGASDTAGPVIWFLPGECFGYPTLQKLSSVRVGPSNTEFSFGIRVKDFAYEGYGKMRPRSARYVPSDELYASFGDNAQIVKSEYDKVFYGCVDSSYPAHPCSRFITVVSDGEITLTADKDIAGYKSGENLPVSLEIVEGYRTHPYDSVNQFFEIPLDYKYMLSDTFEVTLSVGSDYWQQVAETVTFELKMPVKVVMYLSWLNDKISDPDAPVPYEEEVLYCKFTTDFK